jgi:hypothetical protein
MKKIMGKKPPGQSPVREVSSACTNFRGHGISFVSYRFYPRQKVVPPACRILIINSEGNAYSLHAGNACRAFRIKKQANPDRIRFKSVHPYVGIIQIRLWVTEKHPTLSPLM